MYPDGSSYPWLYDSFGLGFKPGSLYGCKVGHDHVPDQSWGQLTWGPGSYMGCNQSGCFYKLVVLFVGILNALLFGVLYLGP